MGTKVTKQILATQLKQKGTWSAQQVDAFVEAFFSMLHEGVTNDGSVKVKGLGTFKTVDVADRASVDVNTGERIVIPGHKKLKFVEEDKVNVLLNAPTSVHEIAEPASEPEAETPAVTSEPAPEPEAETLTVASEPAPEPEAETLTVASEPAPEPEAEAPAVASEPAPEPEAVRTEGGSGTKWWIWVLAALIVVLIAVAIFLSVCSNHEESAASAQMEQKMDGVPSPVQTNQPQYKIHAFQKGESLTTISILYYNNPDSVERIMQINGLNDTSFIPLGTELKLP